ncbi:hypothetical protein, partial [Xanthomonas arboricola]|uniref:hypothetical protein n=1 Tax=Xanthomonas arboricola TaxID=56448 RepID=UPI001C6136B8
AIHLPRKTSASSATANLQPVFWPRAPTPKDTTAQQRKSSRGSKSQRRLLGAAKRLVEGWPLQKMR